MRRRWNALCVLLFALVLAWTGRVDAHEQADELKPPPPLRMVVIAPSAKGPWMLRIDNDSDAQIRIAADVRLLRFEVRSPAPLKAFQKYAYGWGMRATLCDGPSQFGMSEFPADRELVLAPGHSYIEEFDPRLICFGKNADLLVPGAMVKPTMGWAPKPKWQKKMEAAPFVADDAHVPRRYRPMRRIEAPTIVLSHGEPVEWGTMADSEEDPRAGDEMTPEERKATGQPAPKKDGEQKDGGDEQPRKRHTADPDNAERATRYRERPVEPVRPKPPPTDELSAALTLTASRYADARAPLDIELSVQAHNTGERPVFVALRSRMLAFMVAGPDGVVKCRRETTNHQVARDHFATLHHGKHKHLEVMLAEVCPPNTFDRPGLYLAAPILHAEADGKEYGLVAITGVVTAREPGRVGGTHQHTDDTTLVRVRAGRKPFYRDPPVQIPTRVLPPQ